MQYEAEPTDADLDSLGVILGSPVSHLQRVEGGQSATTDILLASRMPFSGDFTDEPQARASGG